MRLSLRSLAVLVTIACASHSVPVAESQAAGGAAPTVSPSLLSAILPASRSVELGTTATVFAALVNGTATALDNCQVVLPDGAPAGLTMRYQTTDPATNLATGTPDTPVTIQGNNGLQTFVLSFTGTAGEPFDTAALAPSFTCGSGDKAVAAPAWPGVNTVDLAMSTTPVPDIVATTGTPGTQDTVVLPFNGAGAFSVAGVNLGVAAAITVSVDTSSLRFPVVATVCQTASDTGQCVAPPAATASLAYDGGTIQTFSVFLQATGGSELVLITDRAFVSFTDDQGLLRGATSVAVGSGSL
jgi:hypothetical protein